MSSPCLERTRHQEVRVLTASEFLSECFMFGLGSDVCVCVCARAQLSVLLPKQTGLGGGEETRCTERPSQHTHPHTNADLSILVRTLIHMMHSLAPRPPLPQPNLSHH